ncbi:MAG: FecR domain-containing protein [Pseudomonadota bacterium]
MTSIENPEQLKRIREQAIDWVLTLDGNEPTPAELDQLENWLAESSRHATAFAQARQLYGEAGAALTIDPDRTKKRIRTKSSGGLAILSVVAGFLIAAPFVPDWLVYLQADLISKTNHMPSHTLADGSLLHMNGDTALVENFTKSEREMTLLQGEAFFNVESDKSKPFVVHSGKGRIEVLGTGFNVNRVGERTEVTVTESVVRVSAGETDVTLTEGMRVSYDDAGNMGQVEIVPEGTEVPWRSGLLIFEDRKLSWVMEEIDRHLPGTVIVTTQKTADRVVSGSFDLSDPEQALTGFAEAFGLNMYRLGPVATVVY